MFAAATNRERTQHVTSKSTLPSEWSSDPGNWDGAHELARAIPLSRMRKGRADGVFVGMNNTKNAVESRYIQLSRPRHDLGPIAERESEDTSTGMALRFVENNPFRSIRAALRTSPEYVSQCASPHLSLGSEQEAAAVEQQSGSSSCYNDHSQQHSSSCPDLTVPTPVARQYTPLAFSSSGREL